MRPNPCVTRTPHTLPPRPPAAEVVCGEVLDSYLDVELQWLAAVHADKQEGYSVEDVGLSMDFVIDMLSAHVEVINNSVNY
jgi:hypothetical protein